MLPRPVQLRQIRVQGSIEYTAALAENQDSPYKEIFKDAVVSAACTTVLLEIAIKLDEGETSDYHAAQRLRDQAYILAIQVDMLRLQADSLEGIITDPHSGVREREEYKSGAAAAALRASTSRHMDEDDAESIWGPGMPRDSREREREVTEVEANAAYDHPSAGCDAKGREDIGLMSAGMEWHRPGGMPEVPLGGD